MSKHMVRITQVFEVCREIIVEVEAEGPGEFYNIEKMWQAPDYHDERWKDVSTELINEECEPA